MTLFKDKYRIESTRLRNWDYRSAGVYFVTICAKNREPVFGSIKDGDMHLSAAGEIAAQCWVAIPAHFAGVELDEFVIMPDHVHGMIVLTNMVVETLHATSLHATSPQKTMADISPKPGALGVVVRSYKSAVSRLVRRAGVEFAWQERYWDHIVRDDSEFGRIQIYIINNPVKWEDRDVACNVSEKEPGLWM